MIKATETGRPDRLLFFDPLRNIAMLSVILYHAVAAYSTITPHWSVHDGTSVIADCVRHLFDVFMMPIFFFIAGFLAVPSVTEQGTWKFLVRKIRRIGIPWIMAILVVVPVVTYANYRRADPTNNVISFWDRWVAYLRSVGTYQVGLLTPERASQMHFWFLSLLLVFLITYALFRAFADGRGRLLPERIYSGTPSGRSVIITLAVAATATSFGYFAILLLTPEMSWITIDRLLQFQPSAVVVYVASFAVGCLAYSRRWFEGNSLVGSLFAWSLAVVALAVAFFVTGWNIFTHTSASNGIAPPLLLTFSFIRTALCVAIMGLLVALCRRYGNRSSRLSQGLAIRSYDIYLVHIFFVVFFQDVLMVWQGGPAMAKAGIAFLAALPVSYGIGLFMGRFSRSFVIGLVALFLLVLFVTL